MKKVAKISDEIVINKIHYLRGFKVMLDKDLAKLYGVSTKRLKEQVRRNLERFPKRYMFELTEKEMISLRSQIATSKNGRGGTRYLPMAFTEHGILMLANALKSRRAIQMSIQIIDVFVKMRELLQTRKDILIKLEQLEKKIMKQDHRFEKFAEEIRLLFMYLKELTNPPSPPRKKIGFK